MAPRWPSTSTIFGWSNICKNILEFRTLDIMKQIHWSGYITQILQTTRDKTTESFRYTGHATGMAHRENGISDPGVDRFVKRHINTSPWVYRWVGPTVVKGTSGIPGPRMLACRSESRIWHIQALRRCAEGLCSNFTEILNRRKVLTPGMCIALPVIVILDLHTQNHILNLIR